MATYQHTLTMPVDPVHVYDYVTEPRNWAQFLPTVQNADTVRGEHERVRIRGVSHGHSYDTEGYLRLDRHRLSMQWGADGEQGYHGSLVVRLIESSELETEISLELRFSQEPAGDTEKEMEQALENIRDHFLRPQRRRS
ncbi:MAG TPA: SRPBCC domain-containing protein [Bryobacteraceae bacterium]|nr:SRPBCC domain-containing protein [Bryobacteraceae bacterium]